MAAEQTYQQEYAECIELIEVLKVKLIRHKEQQEKERNDWGAVGDLFAVKTGLDELIQHFY
jgi:hypothetical protein